MLSQGEIPPLFRSLLRRTNLLPILTFFCIRTRSKAQALGCMVLRYFKGSAGSVWLYVGYSQFLRNVQDGDCKGGLCLCYMLLAKYY